MANLFLVTSVLFFAVIAARRDQYQGENSNFDWQQIGRYPRADFDNGFGLQQSPEFGAIGSRMAGLGEPGIGEFWGPMMRELGAPIMDDRGGQFSGREQMRPRFSSESGEDRFPGRRGGRKFPGNHGRRPHIPAFLANVTMGALKELGDIIRNGNLTKTELHAQIDDWAKKQGDDVAQKFQEIKEIGDKRKQEMKEKIDQVISDTTNLVNQMKAIEDNMSITKAEERQQMEALFARYTPSAIKTMKSVKEAARLALKPFPKLSDMTESAPDEMPSFNRFPIF